MKIFKSPRVLITLSMAIFGTLAPFVRNVGLSSGEIALYRAVTAIMLIGAFLAVTGKGLPIQNIARRIPLLVLSGVAMGFNWILLFEAYKYTTVSVATLSYYFAPVIVTVVSPFLFREKLTFRQAICFIMSTLGIVLITGLGGNSPAPNHLLGILFGLGAAVLYAAVVLINKFISGITGIHRTFMQFVAAAVVLAPYVALTSGFNLPQNGFIGWASLVTVGIVHTGITYCMYFSALGGLTGQKAAILSYIDPLVAVIISVTLLGEPLTLPQAVGGALILGFTLYNELSEK
ncbi:MAG: EamA/RhaT family transporter [Ruminococcaceae bacterium]|nr:EamA/RhaT family transporter [Oscillospiraceae bacterium]